MRPSESRRAKIRRPAFWPALAAVVSLLVQALVPAAAMAAQPAGGTEVVVCTANGIETIRVDGETKKSFAGLPCQDCVAACAAVVMAAEPSLGVLAPAYVAIRHDRAAETALRLSRPAARPPGQGPPALLA